MSLSGRSCKPLLYLTFWCLLTLCPFGHAQTAESKKPQFSKDIAALKQDVKTIGAQQQKIINQLNELKQLLAANAVLRPAPQLAEPPSALTIHNESFRGDDGATVAIVEYADFECPYCGEYEHDIYPQISKDYIETGKVKYFYRDLPLSAHPHAMFAARAARCAGEQGKFWEMHDSLFAKQNAIRDVDMPGRAQELGLDKTKFSACLSSDRYIDEINESSAEAQKMGVDGTPTFFIGTALPDDTVTNLKRILGVAPYQAFKSAIEDTLAAKN